MSESLNNYLGWQGWQLDLPASWNPIRFDGDARRGSLVLADLDCVRLELNWRTIRSRHGADLGRLGDIAADCRLTPLPAPHDHQERGFNDVRVGRTANGDCVGMFLTSAGPPVRLLLARFPRTDPATGDSLVRDILATVADASGTDPVDWSVYGFAWSVPAGFTLRDQRLVSGQASFDFRRGRSSLIVERRVVVGPPNEQTAETSKTCTDGCLNHRGHRITPAPASARKWWDRLISGPSWAAEWTCPRVHRRYCVVTAGPRALERLREAVRRIICHASEP